MTNYLRCRQKWSEECELALNKQINLELLASYQYLFLSTYFDRDNIALKPLVHFFEKSSLEEREHANKLMAYQHMRGGIATLDTISNPTIEFNTDNKVLEAFNFVLLLEKTVNNSLLDLHKISDTNNDPQFGDYLEGEFLKEQVEAISELSKYITQLEFIGNNNYGIWEFVHKLN